MRGQFYLKALADEKTRAAIITDVWGDNVKVGMCGDAVEIVVSDGSLISSLNLDPRNARSLVAELIKLLGDA